MRIASLAHVVFAATMIVLGILGLIKSDYAVIWQPIPQSVHALSYVCSVISLATGVGLLLQRAAAAAARVLLTYLLLWLLLLRVPGIFLSPTVDFWWAACKTMAMAAAAWVLYVWFSNDSERHRFGLLAGVRGLRIARVLYGVALIPFGVAHFVYLKNTASLVPHWLPWPEFWAYFTGVAYIAAGVAMLIGVCARLAAALSAVQTGMFTLLVWVPVLVKGPNTFQAAETIVSAALTAAGWMVADSYRRRPLPR